MSKIIIDGVRTEVKKVDGQPGSDSGIQNVSHTSELGDTLKELNRDTLERDVNMSGIDMRARLHSFEISSILAFDALVSLGVLPTKCLIFTRQKKRLSVSLDGQGRDDIVNIVAGKRELDAKSNSMGEKFKGFFGMGQPQDVQK